VYTHTHTNKHAPTHTTPKLVSLQIWQNSHSPNTRTHTHTHTHMHVYTHTTYSYTTCLQVFLDEIEFCYTYIHIHIHAQKHTTTSSSAFRYSWLKSNSVLPAFAMFFDEALDLVAVKKWAGKCMYVYVCVKQIYTCTYMCV
jgi:hypothetical protein